MDFLLADDLTGCCDTGIKFVQAGFPTTLAINAHSVDEVSIAEGVLAVNADTRNLPPGEAYRETTALCSRLNGKFPGKPGFLYKKLDSTLRGNPGAEIAAIADFWNYGSVFIAVAAPALGRIVTRGVLEIDGVPLAQTAFGNDPGFPMRESKIAAILSGYLPEAKSVAMPDNPAELGANVKRLLAEGCRYLIFDSRKQEDLEIIAKIAMSLEDTPLLAGSAGFAQALCSRVHGSTRDETLSKVETILFVCGSANRATHEQVERFQESGFPVFRIGEGFSEAAIIKLSDEIETLLRKGPVCLAATKERLPGEAAMMLRKALSKAVLKILEKPELPTLALYMTGGETAYSILKETGGAMALEREIFPGVIAAKLADGAYKDLSVITKAGGFGARNLLLEIYKLMTSKSQDAG